MFFFFYAYSFDFQIRSFVSTFCFRLFLLFLQAINCLIVWAVLMNRYKLAKLLWGRSDDPIPIALICSDIYKQMANFSMELYQRCEMEQNAR